MSPWPHQFSPDGLWPLGVHGGVVLVSLLLRGRSGGAVLGAPVELFTRDNGAADAGEQASILRQAEKFLILIVVTDRVTCPNAVLVGPE